MEKKVQFNEAVSILTLMLIVLGISVIGFDLMPNIPVLAVIGGLMGWLPGMT